MDFISIPVSIVLGILLGAVVGYGLYMFFETSYAHKHCVRNSTKVIIVLGFSFLLVAVEDWLKGTVAVSGLLAVVSMACVIKMKSTAFVSKRLSEKFGKLWIAAEVILFVLVGAAIDIRYTLSAGIAAVFMILLALLFRSVGVLICTAKTNLCLKERLFCRYCLSSKSDSSGSHWLSASCIRAGMWQSCFIGCSSWNYYNSTSWSLGNRQHL